MKNIVITGVSSGIGLELCKVFTKSTEVKVLGISRNEKALKELKASLGANFDYLAMDVRETEKLAEAIQKQFKTIDILINNAGLLVNKPFEELNISDFQASYEVNVFAPALLIQQLLPIFNPMHLGQVLNISSMGGVQGVQKFPGLGAYSSSKMAIIGITESLAEEFKDKNIHFNCLALGAVNTPMLNNAFPGYVAEVSPKKMATYIKDFILTQAPLMNGKTVQVALSTP